MERMCQDIRILGVKNWRSVALNREEWQILSRNVRFEVLTAMTTKNGVFWDVTPCDCCKNRRFGGT
jgi:hypothetical protein